MTVRIKTDENIAKDVVDSLYWDSRVDASKVSVTVDDGIVTLSGTVPSYAEKVASSEDARLITGVRDIDNQLKVDYRAKVPTDSEVKSNISHALTWDYFLGPHNIDVSVDAGWVTLEGTVDAFWKKVRAEDLTFGRGVVGVTNKIAVVPTQTIVDEKLAENIVNALDRNISVDVDDINVTVDKGTVTLTGSVPTWSSKQAAYNAARYAHGVKHVNDLVAVR
ncbi:MAG TPA: BON domain-containing protein [Anaerolineales bacterium]|nr:BON domain-containing protein [Anaerolineales bacterium]